MQELKKTKENILSVVEGGDILIIVPPFGSSKYPTFGPHAIQSFAKKIGYKIDMLYLNLLLSSIIGIDLYESIAYSQFFWMLGERLFARSAYGLPPLGKTPELCHDEALSISGIKDKHNKMNYGPDEFDLETYKKIEIICKSFVDEVIPVIASINYKIVGCSITWEQTNCSIALLNGIKRLCPETIMLLGGAKCEGEMAEGIASLSDAIDYVFSGESELTFNDFLKDYATGELPSQRIIVGKPLKNLDDIPPPDYKSFFEQMACFFGNNFPYNKAIRYETSRGCWKGQKKRCTFCSISGVMYRQKSEEKIINELEELGYNYPDASITIIDDDIPFSFHKKLLPSLSKKSDSPPITSFVSTNLKLQHLINLKEARIETVTAGIETLSTELLKLTNKGVTAKQNLLFLRNTRVLGIHTTWFLLWGFPGDKVEYYKEILRILPLIRHLQPPAALVHLLLFRFSLYFENQQNYKISNLSPWAAYRMVYPEWAKVDKLACCFVGDYPCEAHENPDIIQEIANEVAFWKKTWGNYSLVMKYFMGAYVIYDNRDFLAKTKMHSLDYQQAKAIMTSHIYQESGSGIVKWAVEEKLGVVIDSWYVPLVTASPELLLEFAENQ
jgi:ribosomal peptide maturation radical SAM protein 1